MKTGLLAVTLMLFLIWFSVAWLLPSRYSNSCFLVDRYHLILQETTLPSGKQEASPSAGKNTGVVQEQYCAWECDPAAILCVANIPVKTFVKTDEFSLRVMKKNSLTTYLVVFVTFFKYEIVLVSKVCKSDGYESQNSLGPSWCNILSLLIMILFFFLWKK